MWQRYLNSDALVHMMTAQFSKFGHQSRNDMMDRAGRKQQVIIPLKDRNFRPLNEIQIMDPFKTFEKIEKTLKSLYGKAPHGPEMIEVYMESLCGCDDRRTTDLATVNMWLTAAIIDGFNHNVRCNVPTQFIDHELGERPDSASEWVAWMGEKVECGIYIGGGVAKDAYVDDADFERYGVKYVPQDWTMPEYFRGGNGKFSNSTKDGTLSIIDPLAWLGWQGTYDLLMHE